MTSDIELAMKAELDGKFYSFVHNNFGELKVGVKPVPKDYFPRYNFEKLFQPSGSRYGRYSRTNRIVWAEKRRQTFWTEEKLKALIQHYHAGYSARRIGRIVGIGRWEVGLKLNELGLLSRYGVPYQS